MESNIPWRDDADYPYFVVRTEVGIFDFTPYNTAIYSHLKPHQELDHLFRHVEADERSSRGLFVWRKVIEKVLDASFEVIAADMRDNGFEQIVSDGIDEDDLDVYVESETYDLKDYPPDWQ